MDKSCVSEKSESKNILNKLEMKESEVAAIKSEFEKELKRKEKKIHELKNIILKSVQISKTSFKGVEAAERLDEEVKEIIGGFE